MIYVHTHRKAQQEQTWWWWECHSANHPRIAQDMHLCKWSRNPRVLHTPYLLCSQMQAMAAHAKTHPSPTRSTVKNQENIMIMIMDSTVQHLRKSIILHHEILANQWITISDDSICWISAFIVNWGKLLFECFMEHIPDKGVFFGMLWNNKMF
jgi:hypothetical protein